MQFELITLALPTHWLTAVAYGDTSGMDDTETGVFSRWLDDTTREFGEYHIAEVSDDPYFARYHDAAEYGVLACNCVDVMLAVPIMAEA